MIATALDAKAKLEAEGLHVSCNTATSLWIAATLRDTGAGIKVSNDACVLAWKSNRWIAILPAQGMLAYEVPGDLPELVSLIVAVYTDYRQAGGPLNEAVIRVIPQAEQFLIGRSPAHV